MKPNILFIMADQFRFDALGCVGGYANTPNLDKLAGRGCLFTNAFANSVECVPSRISLATGLYPHQFGVDRNLRCSLNPDVPNWMQAIAAAGYSTSLFGKSHFHPTADLRDRLDLMHSYGFQVVNETAGPRALAGLACNLTDLWNEHGVLEAYRQDLKERLDSRPFVPRPTPLPLDLYYDRYVGRVASEHLERTTKDQPWFCCVSFGGPHEPWDAPEPYASMYAPDSMPLPKPRMRRDGHRRSLIDALYESRETNPDLSLAEVAAMRANYAGSVTLIDEEIGNLIDLVESRGQLEHTLIVFTSDHGEMNGDYELVYKANFYDPAVKVPLIIVPPEHPESNYGRVLDTLVELLDVGATLTDYAGALYPERAFGSSLRAQIEGNHVSENLTTIVSEFAAHTCIITEDLKVEFDAELNAVLGFDRINDPNELTDISQDSTYAGRIGSCADWLFRFRSSTIPTEAAILDPH